MSEMFYIDPKTMLEVNLFIDWVMKQNEYPIEFLLGDLSYKLPNELWRDMFVVGFTAGVECGTKARPV